MSEKELVIPFLADTPVDTKENQATIQAAGVLLRAAKRDELVSVVCTHEESLEKHVILCAMTVDEDGNTAGYTPVGMLFTVGNTPWTEYAPPAVAVPKAEDLLEDEEGIRETA